VSRPAKTGVADEGAVIDRWLRQPKERLLVPLARGPLRGVSPTMLTVAACALGLLGAVAAAQRAYPLALGLWLANRALDGLDGTVARAQGKQTDFGGYLDIVLDTVVYAALPLGLALGVDTRVGYLCLALLIGSFYINAVSWLYQSALLEKFQRGALTTLTIPTGLVEGTETVAFYCLFIIFPGALPALFGAMAGLVAITVAQRLWWATTLGIPGGHDA